MPEEHRGVSNLIRGFSKAGYTYHTFGSAVLRLPEIGHEEHVPPAVDARPVEPIAPEGHATTALSRAATPEARSHEERKAVRPSAASYHRIEVAVDQDHVTARGQPVEPARPVKLSEIYRIISAR